MYCAPLSVTSTAAAPVADTPGARQCSSSPAEPATLAGASAVSPAASTKRQRRSEPLASPVPPTATTVRPAPPALGATDVRVGASYFEKLAPPERSPPPERTLTSTLPAVNVWPDSSTGTVQLSAVGEPSVGTSCTPLSACASAHAPRPARARLAPWTTMRVAAASGPDDGEIAEMMGGEWYEKLSGGPACCWPCIATVTATGATYRSRALSM